MAGELIVTQDHSAAADATIAQSSSLSLDAAVEALLATEKIARLGNDIASTTKLSVAIVKRCVAENAWEVLNENVLVLSKRRGQFKETMKAIVQECMQYLATLEGARKKALISVLQSVCEGKIHLELERATLVKTLAAIREAEGDLSGAAEIIQEVAVETVGSMEKTDKIEFVLEQMRLVLTVKDFVRAGILSKKVTKKALEDQADTLKIRYYMLLLQILNEKDDHLGCANAYFEIYNTDTVKNNLGERKSALHSIVKELVLAKYDNQQQDMARRVSLDRNLEDDAPELKKLLDGFLGKDLLDGNKVFLIVGNPAVQKRVVEHNIRVISSYYTRCTLDRLGQLIHLSPDEAERSLCEMVSNKDVFARVDRLSRVVVFKKSEAANEVMDAWASRVSQVFELVDKCNHLIHKENMVHKIA
eukprot:ANDGO_04424.mRNA.1 26S proteasome non-ATPase regulatory subunit 12